MDVFGRADLVNGDDVRVVQGGGGLGLLNKASQAVGVLGEFRWEQLERDPAFEARVKREINFTHPAFAQQGEDLVMADHPSDERLFLRFGLPLSRHFEGRRFDEIFGAEVEAEKRFDLAAQLLIALASFGEKRGALGLREFQSRVPEPLDPPPQLLRLFRPHRSHLRSARARARLSPTASRALRCRARPSTPPPFLPRSIRRRNAARPPGSSVRQHGRALPTRHRVRPGPALAPPPAPARHRARPAAALLRVWRSSAPARSPPESAASSGPQWRRSARGFAIAPDARQSAEDKPR